MANTDVAWEKWGANDPYFGVVSFERFKSGNIDDHRAEFFKTGEDKISAFLAQFERSFGDLKKGKALDYGCGVGRLTLALGKRFENVVGVDISESMLAEARKNACAMKQDNVRFNLPDKIKSSDTFDFVNSYIVLQHIPIKRGVPILFDLIDNVVPGGGFMVHFSLRQFNALSKLGYWARHNIPGMTALQNIRYGQPIDTPAMQMNDYPLVDILGEFHARGIHELLISTERHGSVLTVGLIGRKPA